MYVSLYIYICVCSLNWLIKLTFYTTILITFAYLDYLCFLQISSSTPTARFLCDSITTLSPKCNQMPDLKERLVPRTWAHMRRLGLVDPTKESAHIPCTKSFLSNGTFFSFWSKVPLTDISYFLKSFCKTWTYKEMQNSSSFILDLHFSNKWKLKPLLKQKECESPFGTCFNNCS